jgi:hypothetical protein
VIRTGERATSAIAETAASWREAGLTDAESGVDGEARANRTRSAERTGEEEYADGQPRAGSPPSFGKNAGTFPM